MKSIKKKKTFIVFIVWILFNSLVGGWIKQNPIIIDIFSDQMKQYGSKPLGEGIDIEQVFYNNENELTRFSIFVGEYFYSDEPVILNAELLDFKSKTVLGKAHVSITQKRANSYIDFFFQPDSRTSNNKLIFKVTAKGDESQDICLISNSYHTKDMYSIINDKAQDGSYYFSYSVVSQRATVRIWMQANIWFIVMGFFLIGIKKYNLLKRARRKMLRYWSSIVKCKKEIMAYTLYVIILAGCSAGMEYLMGGYFLHTIENQGEYLVQAENIETTCEIDQVGRYITTQEEQIIKIKNNGSYIRNINMRIDNLTDTSVKLMFKGDMFDEQIVNFFPNNNGINVMDMVFPIQDIPGEFEFVITKPGVIISKISIDNTYYFNVYRWLFIWGIGILLCALKIMHEKERIKVANVFLLVALIAGSIMSISAPISTKVSWDEEKHYDWALELSYFKTINKTGADEMAYHLMNPRFTSYHQIQQLNQYIDNIYKQGTLTKQNKGSVLIPYTRIGHIPSAVMIGIGRILQLPYHIIFILGRWINLIVYALVIYRALCKLKTGRVIMAIIALFPTSMFVATNYSYDWWVSCFTMLGLAYLLSEIQQSQKKLTLKEILIMVGAFVLGLGPKAIYFPLLVLLLFIKADKFQDKQLLRTYRILVMSAIIIVCGSFMLPFIVQGPGVGDIRGGEGINAAQQVRFVLTHPLQYTIILINYIKDYIGIRNIPGYTVLWAYIGMGKNYIWILITMVIAIFTDKNDYDEYTSKGVYKMVTLGICLFTVALICSALYVSYTAVEATEINGVQPRYLIPLLFPVLVVLGTPKIKNTVNTAAYSLSMLTIPTIVLFQMIWEFYINVYI